MARQRYWEEKAELLNLIAKRIAIELSPEVSKSERRQFVADWEKWYSEKAGIALKSGVNDG